MCRLVHAKGELAEVFLKLSGVKLRKQHKRAKQDLDSHDTTFDKGITRRVLCVHSFFL